MSEKSTTQTPFLRKPITILLLIALLAWLCYFAQPFIGILTQSDRIHIDQVEELLGIQFTEATQIMKLSGYYRGTRWFNLHLATSFDDINALSEVVCGDQLTPGFNPFLAFNTFQLPNFANHLRVIDANDRVYYSYSPGVEEAVYGTKCSPDRNLLYILALPAQNDRYDVFLYYMIQHVVGPTLDTYLFPDLPFVTNDFSNRGELRLYAHHVCLGIDQSRIDPEEASRFQVFVNDVPLGWFSQERRQYSLEEYEEARGRLLMFQHCSTNDLEYENILRVDSYLNDQFVESHSLTFYGP